MPDGSDVPRIGDIAATFLSRKERQRITDEEPRWLAHYAELVTARFATAFRAYADAHGSERQPKCFRWSVEDAPGRLSPDLTRTGER